MRKFLLVGASLVALSVPAAAADLAVKAPPIAVPLFTWTGFYIGANAGVGGDRIDYPFTALGVAGGFDVTSFGGFAGGQIGYNYQFAGGWVLGVEADAQWSNIRSEVTANVAGGLAALNAGTEVQWFGTVRGRLGYGWDRVLLYATGGYAYGQEDTFLNVAPGGVLNFSRGAELSGWTVGGGVEYAVTNNLSFKTEYLYFQFDRNNVFTAAGAPPPSLSTTK